ncbi:glycosyltransferase family 2 protein [Xanthomarina gelatinilytica]|uniref:glycosyltransferase family 2 protein n=1 Tax=Xanthomarina gelatinilytica TaxID=1137281 RepID=UPI003AA8CEAD
MLITIITINYNNLAGLKKTMTSVLNQTYSEIEYIVIDGGSTDGSKEYIESKDKNLAYWVSEPDQGIYHAMNKGIDKATGEYLLFINSGDWLVNNVVIKKFIGFKPVEDLVYGDHFAQQKKKWTRQYAPKTMSIGIALTNTINHQSIFFSKQIFQNDRYNLDYKILADWVLTNNAIIFNKSTTRYVDLVICYYDLNGISSNFNLRHEERNRYLKEHFNPLFLRLLKDYKKLNKKHSKLKNNPLVRLAIFLRDKKQQFLSYFKKQA